MFVGILGTNKSSSKQADEGTVLHLSFRRGFFVDNILAVLYIYVIFLF